MAHTFENPAAVMHRALELARHAEGLVEPNPMVGAVVVDDDLNCLGEGLHQKFGGPHAEVHALREAGERARGATLYVTLEPCCHYGKTPPCTDAVLEAGIRRVVVAALDPFPAVAGQGVARLRAAGVSVETGLLAAEATELTAPFRTLILQQRPFVIAKWAMSLDGKLAAHTGVSKWISNSHSRAMVHRLRDRVDAILVGIGTVLADDPLLTARLPADSEMAEPRRTATRVVVDSQARLPLTSQLVRTARGISTIVFATSAASPERVAALRQAGVNVQIVDSGPDQRANLSACLRILGEARMTNVLVEGGSGIFGALFDLQLIDEVQAFVAPILIGGAGAASPLGGAGLSSPELAARLLDPQVADCGGDIHLRGRLRYASAALS